MLHAIAWRSHLDITVLTPDFFSVPSHRTSLGVLTARKRYPEALECLLAALTAPSMVTNAIAVAAYKKWALVNLIYVGKLPALPRWAPVAVSRAVKLEGGPYQVQTECKSCRKFNCDFEALCADVHAGCADVERACEPNLLGHSSGCFWSDVVIASRTQRLPPVSS